MLVCLVRKCATANLSNQDEFIDSPADQKFVKSHAQPFYYIIKLYFNVLIVILYAYKMIETLIINK